MKPTTAYILTFILLYFLSSCQQVVDKKVIDTITIEAGEIGKRVISFEENLTRFQRINDSLTKALHDTLGETGIQAMKSDSITEIQFNQLNNSFTQNIDSYRSILNTYKSYLLTVNAFLDSVNQNKIKPEEVFVIWSAKKAQSDELFAQGEGMNKSFVNWQNQYTIFLNESLRFRNPPKKIMYYPPKPPVIK